MKPGGRATILVTSLDCDDTPADAVDVLVDCAAGCHRLRTPKLPLRVNGAGDAMAAIFLFHMLRTADAAAAMQAAASAIHALLRHTLDRGSRELALVAAQQQFVSPDRCFHAEKC